MNVLYDAAEREVVSAARCAEGLREREYQLTRIVVAEAVFPALDQANEAYQGVTADGLGLEEVAQRRRRRGDRKDAFRRRSARRRGGPALGTPRTSARTGSGRGRLSRPVPAPAHRTRSCRPGCGGADSGAAARFALRRAALEARDLELRPMDRSLSRAQDTAIENAAFLRLLPPAERERVVALFIPQSCRFGDVVIAEGSPAVAFHLVVSGRLRVVKLGRGGEEITLNVLKAGDSFGERALLEGGVHGATVRCSADAELLVIAAGDFRKLLEQAPGLRAELELLRKHRALHNFLREFSRLSNLPLPALRALLERLEELDGAAGHRHLPRGRPARAALRHPRGAGPGLRDKSGRERTSRSSAPGTTSASSRSSRRAARGLGRGGDRLPAPALSSEAVPQLMAEYPELAPRSRSGPRSTTRSRRRASRSTSPRSCCRPRRPREQGRDPRGGGRRRGRSPGRGGGRRPADGASPFTRRQRRIRAFPSCSRSTRWTAAPRRSRWSAATSAGRSASSQIRQLVHTSSDGTSLMGSARGRGSSAWRPGPSRSRAGISTSMPLPAIIHWEGNHWVVLYDVDEQRVRVADPAVGLRRTIERGSSRRSGPGTRRSSRGRRDSTPPPRSRANSSPGCCRSCGPTGALLAKVLALARGRRGASG